MRRVSDVTGFSEKEVLLFIGTVLLGVGILVGNFFHYENVEQRYQTTYDDQPDALTINPNTPAQVTFTLKEAAYLEGAIVTITFRNIDSGVGITPIFNNKRYERRSGMSGGSVHSLSIPANDLRTQNTLKVEGSFGFTSQATIQSVSVSGVTMVQRITFLIMNIAGLIIILAPTLLLKYYQYKKRQNLEEQFPNFLRDVVEGTRAGMSLPQAIENAKRNNYGDLTPFVQEIAAKLGWGIPFERVMNTFARKTGSRLIRRSVSTLIQTYQAGGNVTRVLETIGDNLKEIRKLRRERESQIYGEMVTGYIVFFAFLLVLVVLIRYLLPAMTFSGISATTGSQSLSADQLVATYRPVFRWLVVVQSIFSGLVIGRLSEGELKAGAKHVAILLPLGYTVSVLFM